MINAKDAVIWVHHDNKEVMVEATRGAAHRTACRDPRRLGRPDRRGICSGIR